MFPSVGSKNSKTPIETLRTATAVGVQLGDIVGARAAYGVPDERSASMLEYQSDYIRFGFPYVRILDFHHADSCAQEFTKPLQDQGMGCARCSRSHDLFRDGQVDADHAIFKKTNPVVSEQLGDNTGQCRIEKGSRTLRVFLN